MIRVDAGCKVITRHDVSCVYCFIGCEYEKWINKLHLGYQVVPLLFAAPENIERLIWLARISSRADDFRMTRSQQKMCSLLGSLICQLTSNWFSFIIKVLYSPAAIVIST
jgi:hypothetical protein